MLLVLGSKESSNCLAFVRSRLRVVGCNWHKKDAVSFQFTPNWEDYKVVGVIDIFVELLLWFAVDLTTVCGCAPIAWDAHATLNTVCCKGQSTSLLDNICTSLKILVLIKLIFDINKRSTIMGSPGFCSSN